GYTSLITIDLICLGPFSSPETRLTNRLPWAPTPHSGARLDLLPCDALTTCCRQGVGRCCAARGVAHDEQPPGLQPTHAVPDRALGTGQSRSARRMTTRHHPMGPLLIGRSPAEAPLLAW